jgi:cytochrome-b5 reductase
MPNENIELILLFANKTQDDIILKDHLKALEPKVKIHHILDSPHEGWNGFRGYVNEAILQEICPLGDPDTLYTFSGPPGFNFMMRDLFGVTYKGCNFYKF